MKKLFFILIIIIIIVAGLIWYLTAREVGVSRISSDTTISGDLIVEEGKKLLLSNGATITVTGNLIVKGEIACENGPLNIVVKKDATIENKLTCERPEELPEGDIGAGISLVIEGSANFESQSEIITNGHIQIVNKAENLATTQEKIEELYEDAASDTGEGNRLGPFIKKEETTNLPPQAKLVTTDFSEENFSKDSFSIIETAYAQAGPIIKIKGNVRIKTPPKGVKLIVVYNFPGAGGFNFQDFWLIGPDGRKGKDDKNNSCDAKGKDGQNAMRLLVMAPIIKINDFTIELGSGGDGGDAETKQNTCLDAKATGGEGGKAGNFKIIASKNFDIQGDFTIYPGRSGSGGSAEAYGKNGDPVKDGGNATAKGGNAKDNQKAVRAIGTINGKNNIKFGSMEGGSGGSALSVPGDGGAGRPCKSEKGGDGGKGIAEGGKGGDAFIFLMAGGAGRTKDAKDIGGDGGFVQIIAAKGGRGSDCDPKNPGGKGGKGGEAKAIPGQGGIGGDKNGKKGDILDEKGGKGGDGGDGCPEGKGGEGGKGNPDGDPGKPGKNICPAQPQLTFIIGLDPTDITFEHQIGFSPCPQRIGTVSISNLGTGTATGWQVQGSLPNWLSVDASGSLPGSVNLNFNCVLDEYITQTLSGSFDFQLTDQGGNPVGNSASVSITGYVSGED